MGPERLSRLGSTVHARRPEGSSSMPVLAFPGPAAPAPPPVRVEVPEGWDALPAGPDLLRARGTGAAGEPVEVAVRCHTGPAGLAASELVDALAGNPPHAEAEVEPSFVVDLGGRQWVARNLSWDESTGPVVEVHLAAEVEDTGTIGDADAPGAEGETEGGDAGVSRLVVATGRVRGSALEADYDMLQSVLETLVVGGTG
jgi:hypothetical protein